MNNIENISEIITTDVLIVGGGFGGLIAAIKAKEQQVNVLVVDKQTVGWSGKATKVGGMVVTIAPQDDSEKFIEWFVKNVGDYLNDQEILQAWTKEIYPAIQQLDEWGVNIKKDEEGKILTVEHFWDRHCSLVGIDLDMLLPLRARARKAGVKIINKVQVVDLLKRNGQVVGAIGFDIMGGRPYVFKAKSVILANGSCDYGVQRMWTSARGDGIAAAYRAGAEMRNAEFGNFYDTQWADTSAACPEGRQFVINALGENVTAKYMPGPDPVDITVAMALGMEKDVLEGKGPLYVDMAALHMFDDIIAQMPVARLFDQKKLKELTERTHLKEAKYGPPQSAEKREVHLGLLAELSAIRVDHEMKTSLTGLWAIGDACHGGSALSGAVPAPPGRMRGNGLGFTLFSAMRGGPSAARFALKQKQQDAEDTEIKRLNNYIFAPLKQIKGVKPDEIINDLQKVVCPTKYNLRRSKERLEEGLSKISELDAKLSQIQAQDGHSLCKCHEAIGMVSCAEMTFKAALMRTESRGWHFREDYPTRDDKNWLKWIILKRSADKMMLSTEDIPVSKYVVRP